ncbi:hypothetical protein EPUL_000978 [Erysiphe pulchra]|uniref:Uncharacterized protein n=1 Tax=Erysiphe pulchra TaxID=225359 RepID=A0A2S4PY70_9PEZI|nr:hypothetical protein EPUL_000978 [Erysiphe pulchra]
MIANGLYPDGYRFPETGDLIPSPGNLEEMREISPRRRPSLSKERFTEADFEAFKTVLENPVGLGLTKRNELEKLIIPSSNKEMLMSPNFFLEVKSTKGQPSVVDLQALHTGALGERGQMALRGWRREGLGLDEKAHTITATYIHGQLQFYSIHAGRSRIEGVELEFFMNCIDSVSINGNAESFRTGLSMYRNLRDFAKEPRNKSISMANEMAYRTEDAEI